MTDKERSDRIEALRGLLFDTALALLPELDPGDDIGVTPLLELDRVTLHIHVSPLRRRDLEPCLELLRQLWRPLGRIALGCEVDVRLFDRGPEAVPEGEFDQLSRHGQPAYPPGQLIKALLEDFLEVLCAHEAWVRCKHREDEGAVLVLHTETPEDHALLQEWWGNVDLLAHWWGLRRGALCPLELAPWGGSPAEAQALSIEITEPPMPRLLAVAAG